MRQQQIGATCCIVVRMNAPLPLPRTNSRTFTRAATALLISRARQMPLKDIINANWPRQKELITRAATAPATMASVADLVGAEIADAVTVLAPSSAAATIFARGLQFRFDGAGNIILPHTTGSASNFDFIAEGAPLPVIQTDTSASIVLQPKKMGGISTWTRETFLHSTPNIETVVRTTLDADIGMAIDSKLLDAVAGSSSRPAGLLNGIAAETESNAANPLEAMVEDVSTLIGAIAATAGNDPVLLIAAAPQAAGLRLWNRSNVNYEVLSTGGLTDGVVVALAVNAFASAGDIAPRFELANETTLHFENTTPLDITTAAVATTVKNLFQSDLIGLRTVFEISWGLRAGGLSWLQSANW